MDETPGPRREGAVTSNTLPPLDGWTNLPPELMSYIIGLSLPGANSSRTRMEALYSNRMVSRMWRDIIDLTPSLWNTVSSDLPLHVNSTAIQRSRCSPLDVYIIEDTFGSYTRQKSSAAEVLELATREIGRWSTATLWFPSPHACSLHLTSPAPLLRKLSVTSEGHDPHSTPMALFRGIAPRLESLEVDRLPLDWTSPFILGLRELNIFDMQGEQVSAQQVLDVLAAAPRLERLDISNSTLNHHLHTRPAIIQVPDLKTIKFWGINTEATGTILSSIQAPNCTALAILDWAGNAFSAPGFPEPALNHFSDFQRLTLSANKISTIQIFDEGMVWSCRPPTNLSRPRFEFSIPYDAPAVGIEWATHVIGSGNQELAHGLEVCLRHVRLREDDLSAYYSFSCCQSIAKLELLCDHVPTRPILELLGTWRESDDGAGALPAFPGLEVLVLAPLEGWTFDDLESLVSRRFGEGDDNISQQVPRLTIVLDTSWYCDYGANSKPDLTQLQRLREAKGVECLTRIFDEHKAGMRAVVYEEGMEL